MKGKGKNNVKKKNSVRTLKDVRSNHQYKQKGRRFLYEDYFPDSRDIIDRFFTLKPTIAYRAVDNPATPKNFIPTAIMRQEDEIGEDKIVKYNKNWEEERKRKFIFSHSLSHADSPEHLEKNIKRQYRSIKKKYGELNALDFRIRIGGYIVKMNYLEEDGVSTKKEHSGHMNYLLYDDINILSRIDSEFGYKKINFDEDE